MTLWAIIGKKMKMKFDRKKHKLPYQLITRNIYAKSENEKLYKYGLLISRNLTYIVF